MCTVRRVFRKIFAHRSLNKLTFSINKYKTINWMNPGMLYINKQYIILYNNVKICFTETHIILYLIINMIYFLFQCYSWWIFFRHNKSFSPCNLEQYYTVRYMNNAGNYVTLPWLEILVYNNLDQVSKYTNTAQYDDNRNFK